MAQMAGLFIILDQVAGKASNRGGQLSSWLTLIDVETKKELRICFDSGHLEGELVTDMIPHRLLLDGVSFRQFKDGGASLFCTNIVVQEGAERPRRGEVKA